MDSKQNHGQDSMAVELIRLQALRVFGNKVKADHWLNQPVVGAAESSRLQVAQSETGYEIVKAELQRLGHGFGC